MGVLTGPQAETVLKNLGWPDSVAFSHKVRCFQAGYALAKSALNATGVTDGKTIDALIAANHLRVTGKSTASAHFSFSEFACDCGGRYGCDVIWVNRGLLVALERLRAAFYPNGLRVVSGCRCPRHNAEAGGRPASQHLHGGACDVVPVASWREVKALKVFSGIGFSPSSGKVVHVDVRHLTGFNPDGSTPDKPAVFEDGN